MVRSNHRMTWLLLPTYSHERRAIMVRRRTRRHVNVKANAMFETGRDGITYDAPLPLHKDGHTPIVENEEYQEMVKRFPELKEDVETMDYESMVEVLETFSSEEMEKWRHVKALKDKAPEGVMVDHITEENVHLFMDPLDEVGLEATPDVAPSAPRLTDAHGKELSSADAAMISYRLAESKAKNPHFEMREHLEAIGVATPSFDMYADDTFAKIEKFRQLEEKGYIDYSNPYTSIITEPKNWRSAYARTDDPMSVLNKDIALCTDAYLKAIKKADIFNPAGSKNQRALEKNQKKITEMHSAYAMGLTAACIAPLRGGLNGPNIVRSVSMGITLLALNPAYRNTVVGPIRRAVPTMVEAYNKKIDAIQSKAQGKIEAHEAAALLNGDEKPSEGPIWKARAAIASSDLHLESGRTTKAERMRRVTSATRFTPETAAMTIVGLNDAYYDAMRNPQAINDPDVRAKQGQLFEKMISSVYQDSGMDRISPDDISSKVRIIIAQRMMDDPDYANRYTELSGTDVCPRTIKGRNDFGETKEYITDTFIAPSGQVLKGGEFTVREPKDAAYHQGLIRDTVLRELNASYSVEEFSSVLKDYAVASAIRESHDGSKIPGLVGLRLENIERLYDAYNADTVTSKDQQQDFHKIVMAGLNDAVQEVYDRGDNRKADMEKWVGKNWLERFTQDYSDASKIEADYLARDTDKISATKYTTVAPTEPLAHQLDDLEPGA